ncbi:MAG: GumC family protein [Bradymonadia bacterium]
MAFFKPKSIADYVQIARRVMMRKWLIFGIFFTLTTIIGVVVWRKPPKFTSQALILVQAPKLKDMNTGVGKKIQTSLHNLVPVLKSRTTLERIIGEHDLYKKERSENKPMEWIVNEMRSKIGVNQRGKDSFQVSFSHKNPLTAQLVTDFLSKLIIEQNQTEELKERRVNMERAQQMVNEYDRSLQMIDEKITAYKKDNWKTLQQSEIDNPLGPLLQQLEITSGSIEASEIRLSTLYSELNAILADPIQASGPTRNPRLEAARIELAEARANLRQLEKQYTSAHPDVVAARSKVKVVKQKIEILGGSTSPNAKPKKRGYDPRVSNLRSEIASTKGELKRAKRKRSDLERKVKEAEALNPRVPEVQARLDEMERERARFIKQMTTADKQLSEAKTLYQMELAERGNRFEIQDPANLPISPVGLGRKVLLALGGIVSLLAGILVALIMVYFDQTVYNEYELKRVTDLPVLVSIASYEPMQIKDKRKQRKQIRTENNRRPTPKGIT